ncbi:unnamed protein product [Brugia timori]|uniref:Secreted protein n=1 Tax=Brugia timori TaxID=42155 RepID=A0A0R3Q4S1_9BILA|nr:unnamed protein product [Brugia timori]
MKRLVIMLHLARLCDLASMCRSTTTYFEAATNSVIMCRKRLMMKDSVQAIKPEAEEKFFTIPVSSFMQSDTSNIMNNNKRTSCHTKNLRNNHKTKQKGSEAIFEARFPVHMIVCQQV